MCIYALFYVFFLPFFRQTGLSLNEICARLEEEDNENAQVIMFPPAEAPGADSDEDSEVEEDGAATMSVNHLGPGLLRQVGEIEVEDNSDVLPDIQQLGSNGTVTNVIQDETAEDMDEPEALEDIQQPDPSSRKRKRADVAEEPGSVEKLRRVANKDRAWSQTQPVEYGAKIPQFVASPAFCTVTDNEDIYLPYHFLRLFLPDSFISDVSHKSKLYCIRKAAPEKQVMMSPDNILTSIGLMYRSGYISPAQRPLWWENREDTQCLFAKKAMASKTFNDVLRFTYFTEQEDFSSSDAFWKVRPLFDLINGTANNLVEQPEFVCVDETIVRYFGHFHAKQTNREKPDRFGYKIWVMATDAGELLWCQPYAGAKTKISDVGLGQGPNVVYGLAKQYGLKGGTKLSCDNLFTSFDLCDHLAEKGIGVIGTVRQNRIIAVPIMDKKTADKQLKRGEVETVFDSNICLSVWKDSKPVYMASNYSLPEPVGKTFFEFSNFHQRWQFM